MNTLRWCLALIAIGIAPCFADEKPNYLALAISDGPTAPQRIVLTTRGTEPTDVVRQAYAECFRRAVEGYAQSCKVGFGKDWIVGVICVDAGRPNPKAIIDIETDNVSPEAARAKAIKWVSDGEQMKSAMCQQVAEYSADDSQVARSVAKDPVVKDRAK